VTAHPLAAGAPHVLSIAGSDPRGGAGIQADLRTFAAHGVYGCAAITALTVQNEHAVLEVQAVQPALVARQVAVVLNGAEIGAVKVGMLATGAVARAVAGALRASSVANVAIDPVMHASTGAALLDEDGLDVLRRELLPLAMVLTPNAAEAGALLGIRAPESVAEMHAAAAALRRLGPRWVLVTGGHADAGDDCVDVLAGDDGVHELRVPRVPVGVTHGTGCTHSSAIAALLALGHRMPHACALAQRFVAATLTAADAMAAMEHG